jgi:hypothetical protein
MFSSWSRVSGEYQISTNSRMDSASVRSISSRTGRRRSRLIEANARGGLAASSASRRRAAPASSSGATVASTSPSASASPGVWSAPP